jgi:hypothetical protein
VKKVVLLCLTPMQVVLLCPYSHAGGSFIPWDPVCDWQLMVQVQQLLGSFSFEDLTVILWSLQYMGYRPNSSWLHPFLDRVLDLTPVGPAWRKKCLAAAVRVAGTPEQKLRFNSTRLEKQHGMVQQPL